jgi:hypothetical protein
MAATEISGAAEGDLDKAVLRRLIEHVGAEPGPIHGGKGKAHLLGKLSGFNMAARHAPWCVLVDLDDDADCAPTAKAKWLPSVASGMCLRVVVRSVESWLLADRERIADAISVRSLHIPENPEAIPDPKEAIVNLARRSKRREIREELIPGPKSGRKIGPNYTSRLSDFARDSVGGWRPAVASRLSPSLAGALRCLQLRLGGSLATNDEAQ